MKQSPMAISTGHDVVVGTRELDSEGPRHGGLRRRFVGNRGREIVDLNVAPGGDVCVLWSETALDDRLHAMFFPKAKQRYSLELRHALEEVGELENTDIFVLSDNGMPFPRCKATSPDSGRFHRHSCYDNKHAFTRDSLQGKCLAPVPRLEQIGPPRGPPQ